ncbi:ATP-dependent zinc metalloprotease FtsH [Caldisalinibacter kiritimatiensis]|uniref:ATP-dependent zinc metalloprotease FtsH n=1 Tax=Caldisalinibacter kiritimatiensis TaxID=1304284 RepID=R1CWA6_9FIRM|nr:ATP-dependent zinc metalloprotease FtsH [Caldisalinibacter kiritimatiensis]EOD00914.1 Cell division protein FtsH [Caldisalinibacter kiritimatiensis]
MLKKKIIFLLFIINLIFTSLMISSRFFPALSFKALNTGDIFFITLVTIGLFIYYIKLDNNPQLVPAAISTEKKKNEEKSKENNKPDISFDDVAGLDEIKEELQEIIDFINHSEKYLKMGATIPKGVLFHGPPGTGKTLLAKAVAGETNSTFLYSSGSEFVEKYVGVGAKRIRNLFEKAKKEAPSIIFIDEIDAIGSKRNSDSNNEKDQTLNQLLVEMDGFNKNNTIIVIGATNRLDLLDEALLRPGRFDRHMYVGNPNVKAREEILKVHTKNKPLDSSIDIKDIAKKTHGFSGAQLANIANEAAIIAVRKEKSKIDINDFNSAIERCIAGLELKNPSVLLKEKNIVAHHEAGHATVGKVLNVEMIQKISIVPRGQALGYVLKFPDEDRYLQTKEELLSKIKVFLGGRAAEQVFFNEVTTGAKDDIKKVTQIAKEMVCSYGMSALGNISINDQYIQYSIDKIENEIKKIVDTCYEEVLIIIKENQAVISEIADYLLEHEVIEKEELDLIFEKYKFPLETAN